MYLLILCKYLLCILILCTYIIYIIYIHVYILHIFIYIVIKVNYAINRIYEKAFRSDLSTQIEINSLWRVTYFELLFSVIYLYLVTLLDFFYDFFLFFWVSMLIIHSAFLFHFVLFFKSNWNTLMIMIIMINITIIDKYPLK